MSVFFTSDTHFQHQKILEYCNRPFKNIAEHDETLISNWNSRVKRGDTVYHLGDFGFGEYVNIFNRLNGKILLILGSHDDNIFDNSNYGAQQEMCSNKTMWEFKQKDIRITLCHYALRVWPASHYNSFHLFGHSHNHLPPFGKSFDVGVDGHNFYPWSLDEVLEKMDTLPNNFNLIKER